MSNKMPTAVFNRDSRRSHTFLPNLKLFIAFSIGFVLNHILHLLLWTSTDLNSQQALRPPKLTQTDNTITSQPPIASCHTPNSGIFPLMRDFACGHENMATPRALLASTGPGNGRTVVDVGLFSADETFDAVQAGYVVFGFELNSGSMPEIRKNAKKRRLEDRVHYVEFEADERGYPVVKQLPRPPADGKGYAYIYNAGLSDEVGSISKSRVHNAVTSVKGGSSQKWTPDRVPILRLDQSLPDWIGHIYFLKIDTQGYEWKVLRGAETYLTSNRIQYAQYEFSPKLMNSAHSGDPLKLLHYMITMGAICFDMLEDSGDGDHHIRGRPSHPLETYYGSLMSGLNSTHKSALNGLNYTRDFIGPWDDIMCWFPAATV